VQARRAAAAKRTSGVLFLRSGSEMETAQRDLRDWILAMREHPDPRVKNEAAAVVLAQLRKSRGPYQEDAEQTVLFNILRKPDLQVDNGKSWLRTALKNARIDLIRQHRRVSDGEVDEQGDTRLDPEGMYLQRVAAQDVERAEAVVAQAVENAVLARKPRYRDGVREVLEELKMLGASGGNVLDHLGGDKKAATARYKRYENARGYLLHELDLLLAGETDAFSERCEDIVNRDYRFHQVSASEPDPVKETCS
jgi:DNA-directed RNA polymerase specialized sigma24 family protein